MQILISNKYRILIATNPKCGCTSVKDWFLKIHDITCKEDIHPWIGKHIKELDIGFDPGQIEKYRGYLKLLFIRNPYEKMVSGYIHRIVKTNKKEYYGYELSTFENFIKYFHKVQKFDITHFSLQTSSHFDYLPNDWTWDFVIDIKYLDREINIINQKIGKNIPIHGDSSVNTTTYQNNFYKKNSYFITRDEFRKIKVFPEIKTFYDPELKKMVYQLWKKDFDYFEKLGYHFDI